jgi:ribonuclease HI/retron-type reverse transcriptase
MGNLFFQCATQDSLHKAWRVIKSNGLKSKADETRLAIEDFDSTANRNIGRIQTRIRNHSFEFEPQKGVLKSKSSGGKRGIVMASVHNRVVERALLDVLQDKVEIARQAGAQKSSFGGVPQRSVPHALKFIYDAFKSGHVHFVRSDISGFFDSIPRKSVLERIGQDTDDQRFLNLLSQATTVTLENENTLGEDRRVFPTDEQGVAQGSPLSPLFGNILLQPFDERFNDRGIVCARFIDDFILLGTSQTNVRKAFESARNHLGELGLRCHDPFASEVSPEKAQHGHIDDGFDFLGYNCRPGLLQPSRSARLGILETIRNHVTYGRRAIGDVRKSADSYAARQRYAQTLVLIDRVLRGWGESFAYTNSTATMDDLDMAVDNVLDDFRSWFSKQLKGADRKAKRRMGGVGLLTDVKAKNLDDVPFQVDAGGRFRTTTSTITISTDGALCTGSRQQKKERKPGGWGVVFHETGKEHAGYELSTTNNRMELQAVVEALRKTEPGASVVIRTDSQYVDKIRNKGAVVSQNSDLWKLFEKEAMLRRVKIVWVKGHAGDPHNERADRIAGQQAEEARLISQMNLVREISPAV